MKKRILTALLAGALGALMAGVSHAGPIASRGELQSLLGGAGALENFEAFNVSGSLAATLTCGVLNRAATCNGQSNLVVPGIQFTFGTSTGQNPASGQWNPAGYNGAPSKEILSQGQPLVLDFLDPIQAFGIDLRAFTNVGDGANAQIKLFGPDDQRLIEVIASVNLPVSGTPVFVGWEDVRGIGRVEFQQAVLAHPGGWSPIIDNLEFGNRRATGVPEPSALSLLALALAGLFFVRLAQRARS